MKAKKFRLLAVSALLMAATSSANAFQVFTYNVNNDGSSTNGSLIAHGGAETYTVANPLVTGANNAGVIDSLSHISGNGTIDTLFTVASADTFAGSANATNGSGSISYAVLYDVTNSNAEVATTYNATNGNYVSNSALTVGDQYKWEVASTGGSSYTLSSSLTVSAVPEPEEYALLLSGIAALALRLRNGKK